MTERKPWQQLMILLALTVLALDNVNLSAWSEQSIGTLSWTLHGALASLTQWGLPSLVVMMGSVLFTVRFTLKVRLIWMRYLPLTILGCLFWWAISAVIYLEQNFPLEKDFATFSHCLGAVLEAPANIRFYLLACSVLILYPLIERIAQNKQITLYCILLLFVMGLFEPMLEEISFIRPVTLFTHQLNWGFFRGWSYYILLGVLLERQEFKGYVRCTVYCLGIISAGAAFALTSWNTSGSPGFLGIYIGAASALTGIQTFAVVLFVRQICLRRPYGRIFQRLISVLSPTALYVVPLLFLTGMIGDRFLPPFREKAVLNVFVRASTSLCMTLAVSRGLSYLAGTAKEDRVTY